MYPFYKASFYGAELLVPHQLKSWRTNPCWLSVTAYSTYSQLRVTFTITFILKVFIQKPDNGPRALKKRWGWHPSINGKTSSCPEQNTLTLLPIQQSIQWDFPSKVNWWNVMQNTHHHLVLWLQISGATPPLPYMLSCTGTTVPSSWSWPILLQNPR